MSTKFFNIGSKPNVMTPPLDVQMRFQQAARAHQTGDLAGAKGICESILSRFPQFVPAMHMLGMTELQLGNSARAVEVLGTASKSSPRDPALLCNFGNALAATGDLPGAIAVYDRVVALNPGLLDAVYGRGIAKSKLNHFESAVSDFESVIRVNPGHAGAKMWLEATLRGQAYLLEKEVVPDRALILYMKALALGETLEAKAGFTRSARRIIVTGANQVFRHLLLRAIREAWTRPSQLFGAAIQVVRLNPVIAACFDGASERSFSDADFQRVFGIGGLQELVSEPLLIAMLECMQISGMVNEHFFAQARRSLLEVIHKVAVNGAATEEILTFDLRAITTLMNAIAKQCFINEYVFSVTDVERQWLEVIESKIASCFGNAVRPNDAFVCAIAAYRPLHGCSWADSAKALDWPDAMAALVKLQILDPKREHELRGSIPRLTSIDDATSLEVRDQYEENPYPRWVMTPSCIRPVPIELHLKMCFPHAQIGELPRTGATEVLIAGCGTGQQSIEAAQEFSGSSVVAIDLSSASIAYALRKTLELGITNIQYGQADILKVGELDRTFDVIESVGVLHHMADPIAAWKGLVDILRPNGFMRLGFYSEIARRDVVAVRNYIHEKGYSTSAEDIRRCRLEGFDPRHADLFGNVLTFRDYYGLSECRDLLFHLHEKRYSIPELKQAMADLGLRFLGFSVEDAILKAYREKYPDDSSCTNLSNWHEFEVANPDTFVGMYQFWTQKM